MRTGLRWIGALAGLAPSGAAVAIFTLFGAAPNREAVLPLAGITLIAVGTGWLIGPLAAGSFPSDLRAMVAYVLVGTFAFLVIGMLASVWADAAAGTFPDTWALATRMIGQTLYGLLFLPLWGGAVAPFALVWVIAVRVLRRRAGLRPVAAPAGHAGSTARQPQRVSPRRMGLFAAGLIAAYGLFVTGLPLALYNEPRPPWSIDRPIALFVLFSTPAAIAAIGAIAGKRSLLVAAGAICLAQAYVAFSLVTIGFVIPAILLLVLGGGERWTDPVHEPRTALAASVLAIALTIAAWVATLGLTEEVCWTSTANLDGSLTYERVPVSDTMTVLPGQAASGCDGGTLTIEGMGVGAVLAIGAVAVSAASASLRRNRAEVY